MGLTNDKTWRSNEKPALNNTPLEEILSNSNILLAWKQVKSNDGGAGVDGITIESFPSTFGPRWKKIKAALLKGYYVPRPVRQVEIPKESGGVRKLGIPTILDRVLQQAIAQILSPIFERDFSDSSFGFRPNRSAHGAVKQIYELVKTGYKYAVDVDIEKFFDNVNHDILMHKVGQKVRDKGVLKLIGKYLRAGAQDSQGAYIPTPIGTPQGGPLSPLLSNILLDTLDKELENKGHKFARYADDFMVLTKSQNEGDLVLSDITDFLKAKLKLTVHPAKSKVVPVEECAFLGFTFRRKKISWTEKSFEKFKRRIRELTGRSWGVSMTHRFKQLNWYLRGWVNYFGISQFYRPIPLIDHWIRRRIRMCFWKQWRKTRTKVYNLMKLGVQKDFAIKAGMSRKSYWRMSKTQTINAGISNAWLEKQGVLSVKALWCRVQGYR